VFIFIVFKRSDLPDYFIPVRTGTGGQAGVIRQLSFTHDFFILKLEFVNLRFRFVSRIIIAHFILWYLIVYSVAHLSGRPKLHNFISTMTIV